MELVHQQSDEEALNYQIGEQSVRFDCGRCGKKRFMKIKEIEDLTQACRECRD